MDALDKKILRQLQTDNRTPVNDLAEIVGCSRTVCWRRIKSLEEAGIIRANVALLSRDKVGLPVTVFVNVKTASHETGWLEKFARAVETFPEITEFYRMSGDVDYLLKVVVPDIASYDEFYRRLITAIPLSDVSSNFAMEEIKFTTALPVR
ncbi:AsnC family transcriptional regulator [Sneathiella sp. P13V-1]|uniref:Lrp/AsnC family transcriptional regulator n=1 Tax=Sneathiella sp. P13V-1 TaxID=2697366 RepID=UPI00187B7574|nr:Lrp/AsnC family transcriptional regulator [Sneathiella sp. P13V-1]MBE7637657.1 AsnC family transcriptional regulator [Sneathiella sp. P13V-1]